MYNIILLHVVAVFKRNIKLQNMMNELLKIMCIQIYKLVNVG